MREIKRDTSGVSPVIATILMVAITVVLSATLYMMIDPGDQTEPPEAMSGRINSVSDGWVVQVDAGSVSWNTEKPIFYNVSSGASYKTSGTGDFEADTVANAAQFDVNGGGTADLWVLWNDNNDNDDIDGGDSFKITYNDDTSTISGEADISKGYLENHYEFRLSNTNLGVSLG